jgi:hypothetical protein
MIKDRFVDVTKTAAPNAEPAPNAATPTRNARGRVPEAERAYQRDLMRKRRLGESRPRVTKVRAAIRDGRQCPDDACVIFKRCAHVSACMAPAVWESLSERDWSELIKRHRQPVRQPT